MGATRELPTCLYLSLHSRHFVSKQTARLQHASQIADDSTVLECKHNETHNVKGCGSSETKLFSGSR